MSAFKKRKTEHGSTKEAVLAASTKSSRPKTGKVATPTNKKRAHAQVEIAPEDSEEEEEDDEDEEFVTAIEPSSEAEEAGAKEAEREEDDNDEAQTGNGTTGPEKTFADLGVTESLCDACTSLGFKMPTPIQRESIPIALEGKDIIGLAETGSGKTAAFALPILQALLDKPQPMFGLVLAPTRELAYQISQQFEALGSLINVRCSVIVGGMDMVPQAISLAKKPHIVVATPGRLLDHLENTKGFSLRHLKYLVLDEADRLLDLDFGPILDKILQVLPRERRTMLFSATMNTKLNNLTRAALQQPVRVSVSDSNYQTVKNLMQRYVFIPQKFKDIYLVYLLNKFAGRMCIVFTRTIHEAARIAYLLRALGLSAIPLHGKLSQSARLGVLNKFKAGGKDILVSTDIAARGLDIPSVDLVLNFDLPSDSKTYVHRVGRTARAGKSGFAINIVTQYDIEVFQRIEHALGKKLEEYPTERDEVMVFGPRVNEAQRVAITELKNENDRQNGGGRKGAGGGGIGGGRGKKGGSRRDGMDQDEG
jgi:ATP-dependent RNA helicase DDX47/RRP3